MFTLLLLLLLAGVVVHVMRGPDRSASRIGELVLLYVLVGYCGIPMIVVSLAGLVVPDRDADFFGFQAGGPFQEFLGWAFLGMALIAVMALRYRGVFLIAPAVVWAVFFGGATMVHIHALRGGSVTHGGLLMIFAAHGLVSILLIAGLLASGVLKRRV